MEKQNNVYPEMPTYQRMHEAPPDYNQTYPSAPTSAVVMTGMMPSSGQGPIPTPHQPITIQNLPPIPPLGPRPCLVTCPCCHQQHMSIIRMESSTKTHLIALALCVVGLCCCACIPYCVDSCQNANHYCGNCDAYLGTYNK